MTNPCCCCSLQTGTQVIGVLQIINAILSAILGIIGWIHVKTTYDHHGESVPTQFTAVFLLSLVLAVVGLALGILLVMAANRRDAGKCKLWFYITLVVTIIFVILTIMSFIGGGFSVQSVVIILVNIYVLWVVHSFIEEINSGAPQNSPSPA